MTQYHKSNKLNNVCYDIRGAVANRAKELEEQGHNVLNLNIGNPAHFGLFTPKEIIEDINSNLSKSQGYCYSKGLYSARKAIYQYYQKLQVQNINIENIYIGNGVSELIMMSMQALLNNGDEILIPSPDYPLWTASVSLSGGTPIHYHCDEKQNWYPDIANIKKKITKNTKGIVIINPNNPTGAVYSKECLQEIIHLAQQHNLIIFSDEIYDQILYDNAKHHCIASMTNSPLIVTFSGLSKNYRAAGFRVGWMMLTGNTHQATSYMSGLEVLSSMRLCANVPMQHSIQAALGGYQSIKELVSPTGRLYKQRNYLTERLNAIKGVQLCPPQGALYAFPKIDSKKYRIVNSEKMVLDFLNQYKVMIVNGDAFNIRSKEYVRFVFLPHIDDLTLAIDSFELFLHKIKQ